MAPPSAVNAAGTESLASPATGWSRPGETGRTHQIRVHLSALGCPVFGDFLYGTESPDLPGRFALHSAEITFPTLNGESVHLSSPLPETLAALMRS